MPNYRRRYHPGACWFFTVNLQNRRSDLLTRQINLLKQCIQLTLAQHPFEIVAWVVLPEHMHTIWRLPPNDSAYANRWRVLKTAFSRQLRSAEPTQFPLHRKIWQRGYWEHQIRNETDLHTHFDYVHRNPLKHQLVSSVQDWPYSTFHHYVRQGIYTADWCGSLDEDMQHGGLHPPYGEPHLAYGG